MSANVISCLVLQVSDEQCNVDYYVKTVKKILCLVLKHLNVFLHQTVNRGQPFVILTAAVLILGIIIVIGLTLLLLLSPLLRQKLNLNIIQPLLDAFQSCYDDMFCWYSVVYPLYIRYF